ncbi:MAG: hypothetical protein ACYS8X_01040 [Planctomycetota bacterium]|jgi:hypothetical protein
MYRLLLIALMLVSVAVAQDAPPADPPAETPEAEAADAAGGQRVTVFRPGQTYLLTTTSRTALVHQLGIPEYDKHEQTTLELIVKAAAGENRQVDLTVSCRRAIGEKDIGVTASTMDSDDAEPDLEFKLVQELTFKGVLDASGRLVTFQADKEPLDRLMNTKNFAELEPENTQKWRTFYVRFYQTAIENALAYMPPLSPRVGQTWRIDRDALIDFSGRGHWLAMHAPAYREKATCVVKTVAESDGQRVANVAIKADRAAASPEALATLPPLVVPKNARGFAVATQGELSVNIDTGRIISLTTETTFTEKVEKVDDSDGSEQPKPRTPFRNTTSLTLQRLDEADKADKKDRPAPSDQE